MKSKKITIDSEILARKVIEGLIEKKGVDIVKMDLRKLKGAISDYFVVCTGTSDRHVQALSDSVEKMVREDLKEKPMHVEGHTQGEWILLDYFDVIVHIFQRDKREFYNLEDLWGDASFEKIEIKA